MLAPLLPARDDDTAGVVGYPHPALGSVLVLAARPASAEGVDPALSQKVVILLGDRDRRRVPFKRAHG